MLIIVAGPILAGIVILSVWLPLWSHHHVAQPAICADLKSQSVGGQASDELLQEISTLKHRLVPPIGPDVQDAVTLADAMILNSNSAGRRSLFDPDKLVSLNFAGFETLWVLVAAHEQSGDNRYLEHATLFLLDFIAYENTAWLPSGLLWNDHAIGVRPFALGRFWHNYRNSTLFQHDTACVVLDYAMTTALRLADANQYTFGTNHGTMQNLGLLHLGLAFPDLPHMRQFAELAISRQKEQMAYIFGPEGAWRENSAGYHRLGLELTGLFLRYMTLADAPIPPDMRRTYEAALAYYAAIRAPDGSLPAIGDTSKSTSHEEPLTTSIDAAGRALPLRRAAPAKGAQRYQLFEELSQFVWLSADALGEQLVATWSNFRRFGHKHADELSLNLRNRDGRWWTSVGYWPLTDRLRAAARSWPGSNAPHLMGESENSARHSRLLSYNWSEQLAAAELQRSGPDGFAVHRLVVFIEPSLWLIIDSFDDIAERSAQIVWGTDHDVHIQAGASDQSYLLSRSGAVSSMSISVLTSEDQGVQILSGSLQPFAGWVELDYTAVPSSAFVVKVPSKTGWSAMVSRLHYGQQKTTARMIKWSDRMNWQMTIDASGDEVHVLREHEHIYVVSGTSESQIILKSRPEQSAAGGMGEALYDTTAAAYGERFNDRVQLRWKLSTSLSLLLAGHLSLLLVLWLTRPRLVAPCGAMALLCWSLTGVLLHYLFPLGLL